MEPITLQDIFNAAWQAFIVEDRPPAVNELGECMYLTDDGRKCAVGLCIPDGHPAQRAVDTSFDALVKDFPSLFSITEAQRDEYDLKQFQKALHDGLVTDDAWRIPRHDREVIYRDVAIRYGLTVPEGA